MDVLSDILSSMRISGGVVIDAQLGGPSCLVSQFTKEHYARFFAEPAHVIAYHYVRSGRIWVDVPGETPALAEAGCIILLPRNDKHLLYSEPGLPQIASETLIEEGPIGEPARIRIEGKGERTELYCGFLGSTSPENALIQSLPSLMLIEARDDTPDNWLESSLRFAAESASPEVIARLTELLFAEAIRRYVNSLPEGHGGWLNGLREPAISKALSIIHKRYAEELDVSALAREVGMSRSAFATRFSELIGESPMRYCTRWRMRMAGNLLRDGRQSSGNVAYEVGFGSEAAFTRAFKREYGEPPAAWRRRIAQANEAVGSARSEPNNSTLISAKARERAEFCTSADGTQIAWSAMGEGFPMLQPAVWFHQIDEDWNTVAWGHWTNEAIKRRLLIRSDMRGVGRSDRTPPRWTFEALLEDFTAVVEASGVDCFDLLGISHGALVAIAYAARHPERIRKLVLFGGYAAGFEVRGDPEEIKRRKSLIEMGRVYREGDREVFGRMLGMLYWPGARGPMIDWFNQRLGTIMGLNESLQQVFQVLDLRGEPDGVTAQTYLAHSRGDRIIPSTCTEEIAKHMPLAQLLLLESENHVLLSDEPAWGTFTKWFDEILAT
ncbi:alpha/beta fold hydrolase [Novosphingobium sp. Gsoil 351]|uniref:alpha/beta fold hydrolase n=1 Tax=Novosphingobium sp. Gsoil 351 TaxID=2675225 RepID=UPI0018A82962|nr:alpha/beta fold hydrolase [Novosphingobium sp. Gsoil 351]